MKSEEADNWQCVCVLLGSVCVCARARSNQLARSASKERRSGDDISLSTLRAFSPSLYLHAFRVFRFAAVLRWSSGWERI